MKSQPPSLQGGRIRVGIGGWTYAPWRDNFFPAKWPHARELEHASRQVTAIEINGTFYRTQSPASYAKWRDETPDGFVFSVKAQRATTHRTVLADSGESVQRFVGSGIAELGDKLGPLLWQFAPTKRFDAADFGAFLDLLPAKVDGIGLRHVIEARHESFLVPEFVALLRDHGMSAVYTDALKYPSIAVGAADLVYARLLEAVADEPTGYAPAALDAWASTVRAWAGGASPTGLPREGYTAEGEPPSRPAPRDVYVFFINGAKERAPAAAMALIERLDAG